jgi:hypothetical protein
MRPVSKGCSAATMRSHREEQHPKTHINAQLLCLCFQTGLPISTDVSKSPIKFRDMSFFDLETHVSCELDEEP